MVQTMVLTHTTSPHGSQTITRCDDGNKYPPGNEIFIIQDKYDMVHPSIALTGEELDDICKWWNSYKEARK